ncbi:hypothetical protein FRB96_000822 [Tulasnella sp. 330]|nr:hypothetical protein FRB96_000822 [Tulasnella sp. 330]KAG8881932.1 hypothetical protein FRB97_008890 [Tulasnella sp. 331]KAG8887944.1 hypothetical protein FRB98_008702 [Tulasnella sp. 332]
MASIPQWYASEDRKASFVPPASTITKNTKSKKTKKQQRAAGWPHPLTFRATPTVLAEAGFYYPHQEVLQAGEYSDEAVCFMCNHSLSGWEPNDDPHVEHAKRIDQLKCPWAIAICSVQADRHGPGSSQWLFKTADRLPTSKALEKARLGTFGKHWPHDRKLPRGQDNPISSKKLAEAGYVYTPTVDAPDMAACPYCQAAFDSWSPDDDPLALHRKKRPNCPVFTACVEGEEEEEDPAELGVVLGQRTSTRTPRNRKPSSVTGSLAGTARTKSADLSASTSVKKPSSRKTTSKRPTAIEEDPEPEPEPSEQEPEPVKPKKASAKKTPANTTTLGRSNSKSKQRKVQVTNDTATETDVDFDDAPGTSAHARQQSKRASRHPDQKPPSNLDASASGGGGHGRSRSQSNLAPRDIETGRALLRSVSVSRATTRATKVEVVEDAEVDGEDDEEDIPPTALKVTRKKKEKTLRPPSPEPEECLVEIKQDGPHPPAVVKPKALRKSRKPKKSMKPATPVLTPLESDNEPAVEVVEEEVPVVEVVKKTKSKGVVVEDRRTITRAVRDDPPEEEVQQEQIPQPPPKPSKGKARAEPLMDRNVDTDDAISFVEEELPAPPEPRPEKATKVKVKAAPKAKVAAGHKRKTADAVPKSRAAAEVLDGGGATTESEVLSESHLEVSEAESAPTSDSAMDVDPVVDGAQHGGAEEEDDRPNLPHIGYLRINGTSKPAKPVSNGKMRIDQQLSRIPSPTTPRNKPIAVVVAASLLPPPRTTSHMDTQTPKKQPLHALPSAIAAINPEQVTYSFTAEEREMTLEMFVERKMQEAQAQFEADGEREIAEFLARAAEVRKRLEAL